MEKQNEEIKPKPDAKPEKLPIKWVEKCLPRKAPPSTGPNAKCPCGSGKKYKKCCEYKA